MMKEELLAEWEKTEEMERKMEEVIWQRANNISQFSDMKKLL